MTDQAHRTRAARRATHAMFLVCGVATSCWAPMVPFAKTRLGLDESSLGLILLALGGGSMLTMPLAGMAVHYWGNRPVIVASSLLTCSVLPLLAGAASPASLALVLLIFGGGLGALDVSMNAHGIAVQRELGRPIMSAFHALFSVGGLLGAAAISLLLRAGVPLQGCAAAIASVLAVLALSEQRHLLADHAAAAGATFRIVPSRGVLIVGALCFISFLAEGAVLDWSAVFLQEVRRVDVSIAGVGYAAFSIAMAVGRLTGDWLTHRLGPTRMLRLGGSVAAVGFMAVALVPSAAGALWGFVLVGIGAANIVPVLFSASGRVPGVPAGIALATVTTIAYAGLLLGPALVGFVADATSLPTAFVILAGMLAAVAAGAGRVT